MRTLYLDLRSPAETRHYAALVAENGQVLAEHTFDYRLDQIAILTELEQFDPQRGNPALRLEQIQAFGVNLYRKVFAPEMHTALQQALRESDELRLVIRIDAAASGLEQIPWEFLHDDHGFLAAAEKVRFVRCPLQIAPPAPLPPLTDDKLRILCLVSSPLDLPDHARLAVEWEKERLLQALDLPLSQGQVEIEFEDEATLPNLEAALDEGHYHILHYTGHGAYNPRTGGSLVLEDEQGKTQHIGWQDLQFVLKKGLARGLRLVFLSGCQTAKCSPTPIPSQEGKSIGTRLRGGDGGGFLDSNAFSDLARPLIHAGFPTVIAMQYSISDDAGRLLAETFYRSLARGEPVDAALSDARRQVLLHQNFAVQGDFATPVLFSTDLDWQTKVCTPNRHTKVGTPDRVRAPEITFDPAYQVPLQQLGVGFVGRRRELRQIKQLFLHHNVRAIILHGIGGIGKTVTATQAARRLRKAFQGVYAFDCSTGVLSPDQIVVEVHQFLQLNGVDALHNLVYAPMPAKQKAAYVAQVLEQWPLLLIFDNMESLLDKEAQRVIADPDLAVFLRTLIIAVTHGTKFLFTSRYTFRLLEDERHGDAAPVVGYRLQQAYHAINLGDLSRPEAIQVMHRMPSLAQAGFGVKEEIYQKLGGHPYTLNVFAHHCQTRTPDDVLRALGEVTGETARFAMLERAWDKLSARTRDLLKRISVFQKPVPLAALEWVMGTESVVSSEQLAAYREQLKRQNAMLQKQGEPPKQVTEFSNQELDQILLQVLPQQRHSESVTNEIEELIHWGLIVQLTDPVPQASSPAFPSSEGSGVGSSAVGYTVHSLVREFCSGKMTSEERRAALLDAAQFYRNAAKALPAETPEQAFTQLDARHLLFEAEEFEEAQGIVIDIEELLRRWGFLSLAERLLRESAATREGHRKAVAVGSLATIYWMRGDYDQALEKCQEAYAIFEQSGDQRNMAVIRHQIGLIHQDRGDYEAALREYAASLSIAENLGDQAGIAYTHGQIGNVYYLQSKYQEALHEYKSVLQISEKLGDQSSIAIAQHQLGLIHQDCGDYDAALQEYAASLAIKERLGNQAGIASTKGQMARLHEQRGDYEAAFDGYVQALAIFLRLQSPDAQIAVNCLRDLRGAWGAAAFDARWQAQTGEPVPDWLKA